MKKPEKTRGRGTCTEGGRGEETTWRKPERRRGGIGKSKRRREGEGQREADRRRDNMEKAKKNRGRGTQRGRRER